MSKKKSKRLTEVICAVAGCTRIVRCRAGGSEVCNTHYQRFYIHGAFELSTRSPRKWATCTITGCANNARTAKGQLCEMHYYRRYRTGAFTRKSVGAVTETNHGYLVKQAAKHPIAPKSGLVYVHRLVLYEKIGPGTQDCYWCGTEIEWSAKDHRKLVVDHLDGNKKNNDPGNLVPSCHRCNSTRGLFQSWVAEHRDDPFLAALFDKARNRET